MESRVTVCLIVVLLTILSVGVLLISSSRLSRFGWDRSGQVTWLGGRNILLQVGLVGSRGRWGKAI